MLRQTFETVDVTPTGDEYVETLVGITSFNTNKIGISAMIRKVSDINYYDLRVYEFDSFTGDYLGYVSNTVNGLVTRLRMGPIVQLLGGSLFNEEDLSTRFVDPATYSISGDTLFPYFSYWGGAESTNDVFLYDDLLGIWVQYDASVAQSHVQTYNTSDGAERGISVGVGGTPEMLALTGKGTGVSFANNLVTFFNYEYGIIYGVHRLPNIPAGDSASHRRMTFDLTHSRILICDGERLQVQGLSPIAEPAYVTQPVATKEPKVNTQVKVLARVIGSAGEGIAGVPVTFTDEGVGSIAPQTVLSGPYGYAEVTYDGLSTGGAETITATVAESVPPQQAPDQGAGATPDVWEPTIKLDFNGYSHQADLSGIDESQRHWLKGSEGSFYGVSATEFNTRVGHSSVAELKIKSSDPSGGGYYVYPVAVGVPNGLASGTLTAPEYDIDFSESAAVYDDLITDQFAAYGITFEGLAHFSTTGYHAIPNLPLDFIANFDAVTVGPATFNNIKINFSEPVDSFRIRIATNPGDTYLRVYREGKLLIESTISTNTTDLTNYYGYDVVDCDCIEIERDGYLTDNAIGVTDLSYNTVRHARAENGTFGGHIKAPIGVGEGEEVWVGMWVRIPAGYDFSNNVGLVPLFSMCIDESSEASYFGYKDDGGTGCDGWGFLTERPITETRHSFVAHANAMFTDDTWHFMQFYCKPASNEAGTVWRAWIDSTLIWECDGTAAKHFVDTSSTITSFTSLEGYKALDTAAGKMNECRYVGFQYEYAGSDQKLQISAPYWAENQSELLQYDSHGNRYLSPVRAGTL